jgi:hypothetical protein
MAPTWAFRVAGSERRYLVAESIDLHRKIMAVYHFTNQTAVQFFADCIDQLDLAVDQLTLRDRNYNRFALMLIDNIVELALHRRAEDAHAENALYRFSGPKYDEKTVAEAMRRGFDRKVKLARSIGLLSEDQATSIRHLHQFRNAAYHQGQRHEGLLRSLTVFYFLNACTMLSNYEPSMWHSSSRDIIPYRAVKYIGTAPFLRPDDFKPAWTRLCGVAKSLGTRLIADLADDMQSTIEDFDSALEFLAINSPRGLTRNQHIVDCQAWQFVFTKAGRAFAAQIGCNDGMHPIHIVERVTAAYPWPDVSDPVANWLRQLAALRAERNEHAALNKYCQYMERTDALRTTIQRSASELDHAIQEQIDAARGK